MAIIYRQIRSSNIGATYILDPRAGKDHLYMGQVYGGLQPQDGKNLQITSYSDVFRGFKYNNNGSLQTGAPITPNYVTSTKQYRTGTMQAGHPRIMPIGGSAHIYTHPNSNATCEGAYNHAMSLDDQHQPTGLKHIIKSDGTENIISQRNTGFNGSYIYGMWHVWEDIKQNETMHDTDPKAYTQEQATNYKQPPIHCYYHEGTNTMVGPVNHGNASSAYVDMVGGVHKWPLNISPDDTGNSASYYIDLPNAANAKPSHMIGISEIDGNPIFLQTNTLGEHHYYVYKYNVAAHTITTLMQYAQTMTAGNNYSNGVGGKRTASTYGHMVVCPTKWITMDITGTNGYKKRCFYVPNWDSNGRLTPTQIVWDPGNDAFSLGGMNPGTQAYCGPARMFNDTDGNLTGTDIQDRQLPLGHSNLSGQEAYQADLYVAEIHGAYHWNADLQNEPNAAMLSFKNIASGVNTYHQYMTTFNVAGHHGIADSDTRYRSLLVFRNRGRTDFTYMHLLGKVDVPETIRNFMWLNEERSRLMIIGASNSYIYQFGKMSSTTSNSSDLANSFGGYDQTSTNYLWTLTTVLPGRYTHASVDKYGRFIFQRQHDYHGTITGGVIEMYTESTPVTVDLTGNVTTDTITYSGSNFTKNLTVEAFNLFGKRIAASVNLIITGTDMQFDNGTQNKTITTSTSGAALEIVTITGAGTSRISASYGT